MTKWPVFCPGWRLLCRLRGPFLFRDGSPCISVSFPEATAEILTH